MKWQNRWTDAFGILLSTVALFLALGSYSALDPSFNTLSQTWKTPRNVLGYFGSWTSDMLFQLFGLGAWLIPALMAVALFRWIWENDKTKKIIGARGWGATTLLMVSCNLFLGASAVKFQWVETYPVQGLLGIGLSAIFVPLVGKIGSYLLSCSFIWCFCLIWWQRLPEHVVVATARFSKGFGFLLGYAFRKVWSGLAPILKFWERASLQPKASFPVETPVLNTNSSVATTVLQQKSLEADLGMGQPTIKVTALEVGKFSHPVATKRSVSASSADPHPTQWVLPPLSLLESGKPLAKKPTEQQLLETARKITSALKSFDVEGSVTEISPGPIITMYEFQPAPGVRVQKIISVATDLAMTLGAPSVRIMAPIPGKSVAGIEVPNVDKEDVILRDVFEQTLERARSMRLPLTLGKDAEGKPVTEDLSRMPHLLVGGATSMGKSVLVNSLLTGLLCRFTPEQLKLIIVDPKLVEFKMFEDIPHLLLPLVNDPLDASQALKWAVNETKRRYALMQKYSVKNIDGYNLRIDEILKDSAGTPKEGEEKLERFPYILIIIDELAELMLTGRKDVEQSIVRLTQLARAAGIHLIMATQRPSADVVTGLIKSNCPSRAALRVASASDSRIILDCSSAEQLLGRGDMFFTSTGPMGLRRMQSCFVSDAEIEKICAFWRDQGEPSYKEEILTLDELDSMEAGDSDGSHTRDALFSEVVSFAQERGKISTSLIQRQFQIGYTRAARIMEQLEKVGLVGEQVAAGKPRDVLL